ncbi:putative glycosyltransferase, GT0 family [Reinekea forsetii]|uniref:Putative glycosyltransferase, GT0 family n=2 Tax=Reinekea forsetii TaxID=1336806 RepID=A0A2K8KTK5_9GAMM|nr:putative glycosyltransferase, GT0 family [Reinekea forsetii]
MSALYNRPLINASLNKMKLKEYPKSLFTALRLALTPKKSLGKNSRPAEVPVIVTFTSIPSRLHVLSTTVRSLLNQSIQPERIILWLNDDLKGELPRSLTRLVGDRFSIEFRDGHSSHRKLTFALTEYPNHILVTCDDDLMYTTDWLERLLTEHTQHPRDIIAHECRTITYEQNGDAQAYKYWRAEPPGGSQPDTLAIGYGGTLYPANSLHPDALNKDLYMQLTPKADDLWFKAMAVRNNTQVRRSEHSRPRPIPIARSQTMALGHTNIKEDGNRSQWQALLDHFPLR